MATTEMTDDMVVQGARAAVRIALAKNQPGKRRVEYCLRSQDEDNLRDQERWTACADTGKMR